MFHKVLPLVSKEDFKVSIGASLRILDFVKSLFSCLVGMSFSAKGDGTPDGGVNKVANGPVFLFPAKGKTLIRISGELKPRAAIHTPHLLKRIEMIARVNTLHLPGTLLRTAIGTGETRDSV